MAGFKGQAEYAVDEKGRVAIPAKMRAVLKPEAKGTFVVTRGFERCIFAYPLDRWAHMEAQMMSLNLYHREVRDFVRLILRWAEEVVLDKQGRIVLPKPLMEYADITDRALIIGALDHIEIWNPVVFDQYVNAQPADYETLAEQVMGV
ncbi:division/cell wall cluster transcriptional repressor MraZ [Rhodothermus bifroesti]|uniref:Transcriptional regulator MraZ n=1 Tax=Rhodothermus marinus TaxID=29549 RepID=A0A7V2B1X9_RHOMR|nr:division/cell wall cluster transcriptional repressor MraZ [Rhodothermus bifroesti]GBD00411.1 Transcriptional regulator MraZ [bacterium HR18]